MAQPDGDAGFEWQVGVWNRMAAPYEDEVDVRFAPIVEHLLALATLELGESVLDLGTGTGAVAIEAAKRVGPDSTVVAVDISPEMLARARRIAEAQGVTNIEFLEGRGEAIPACDASQDCVLASLSLMYVIDRAAAAREIARVLRPGGRFIGAVWAGAEEADIVRFQQIAGSFAPTPPVEGVGPGSMADAGPFCDQLAGAGIAARVEREVMRFGFDTFDEAWDVLAGVTAAAMEEGDVEQAKDAIAKAMWPERAGAREFRNLTQFIVGVRMGG